MRSTGFLVVAGLVQAILYGGILWLSFAFDYGEGHRERPILEVWGIFSVIFVFYLIATLLVWRRHGNASGHGGGGSGGAWGIILVFAVVFRIILLFSQPIQEIDIYRYIWDGNVMNSGVNPYRYSPSQVADPPVDPDPSLAKLTELKDGEPALSTVFNRVHFKEVPTVYPPVSQLVFAGATALTPDNASVEGHIRAMKIAILVFDLATVMILLKLFTSIGLPKACVIAYAWCPLVVKEFANSGHMDSIAVACTTLAVTLLVKTIPAGNGARTSRSAVALNLLALLSWAAATLAKVYPIVLLPLFARWWACRGWPTAFRYVGSYVALIALGFAIAHLLQPKAIAPAATGENKAGASEVERVPEQTQHDPLEGLRTFLKRWEINDLAFACLFENIRPVPKEGEAVRPRAWFAVTSPAWANSVSQWAGSVGRQWGLEASPFRASFLLTQGVAGGLLICVCVGIAMRDPERHGASFLIHGAFLSLAWLWYLSPTQNPWYWIWALPFVGFGLRSWFLPAGFAFVYYLRFWLMYHYPEQAILGTSYTGPIFFDYVVVWLEHGIVLALLAMESIRRARRDSIGRIFTQARLSR